MRPTISNLSAHKWLIATDDFKFTNESEMLAVFYTPIGCIYSPSDDDHQDHDEEMHEQPCRQEKNPHSNNSVWLDIVSYLHHEELEHN